MLSLVLGVTGSLLAFDQFFILTQGGPDNSTITVVQLIYRAAFQSFDLGQAGALSVGTSSRFSCSTQHRSSSSGKRTTHDRPALSHPHRRADTNRSRAQMVAVPTRTRHPNGADDAHRPRLRLSTCLGGLRLRQPPRRQFPADGYGFGNYGALVHFQAGLGRYFLNSLFVALLTVALVLFISTLAGYAFARFSFPGKNVLFVLILGILMVPAASLLIPLYVLLNTLGLSNSLIGLALVLAMYQLPFAVFMMRIAFEGLPMELEEAAVMDGASSPRTLWSVLIPSVTPGMITVGLFVFLASWNDFVAPLILINDPNKAPLPLAIASIRQQTLGAIDYGATEAGVVVLAIPCVVLFLVLQRFYVRGFMTGALKG